MDKIDNAIDSAYRALAENLSKDNILLYSEVPDPKLQIVFSTLHTTIDQKNYAEEFFVIVEVSGNTEKLRHSFFFGIVSLILNSG